MKRRYLGLTFFSVLFFSFTALLWSFSSGPLPSLTGGFQEQSCNSCHSSFELNQGRTLGGVFHLAGVPKIYSPGMTYPVTVIIGQPSQSRWGFELSTRFSASGQQAGELVPVDATTQIKESNGVQYVAHTAGAWQRLAQGDWKAVGALGRALTLPWDRLQLYRLRG